MADVTTVSFSGSSAETIEKAKAFWKCKNPPPEQKSTLTVSGINHRLKRAPQVGEGSLKHCFKTSLGTKQLTSPKRSYIRLNCKLAARHFLESWEVDAGNRDGGIHLPS